MQMLSQHLRQNPPKLLSFGGEEMIALVTGLADGHKPEPMSGMISYRIFRTLVKAAGLDADTWGICKVCGGEGLDPAVKEAYEAWQCEGPPQGPGWQLWETVSEGSPVSPVFPDKEAFVQYLIGEGYSEKAARNFTESGWAPSGVIIQGGPNAGVHDGIAASALDDGMRKP
jgi:hypothetical protein